MPLVVRVIWFLYFVGAFIVLVVGDQAYQTTERDVFVLVGRIEFKVDARLVVVVVLGVMFVVLDLVEFVQVDDYVSSLTRVTTFLQKQIRVI